MIGKTECGKCIERAMSGLRLLNPTSQPEAMFLLVECVRRHDRPPHVMVLDFSKSASVAAQNHEDAEHQSIHPNNAATQHGLLEALMDATVCSYKCSGMVGQLSRPHVVVFASSKPDRRQMNPTRFINCEVSTVINLDVHSDDFRAACAKIERAAADDDSFARHAEFFVEHQFDSGDERTDVESTENEPESSYTAGALADSHQHSAPDSIQREDSGITDTQDEAITAESIYAMFDHPANVGL